MLVNLFDFNFRQSVCSVVYAGVVNMKGLVVTIEWEWAHREYSVGWQNHYGESFPVLPVGSKIKINEDGCCFHLKVEEIRSWYDADQKLNVYMDCSITDEVYEI